MAKKYRFRLANQRIIGPFQFEEVRELVEKKHIDKKVLCQNFPMGDWKEIEEFPEVYQLFSSSSSITPPVKEEAPAPVETTSSQEAHKTEVTQKEVFEEFKFGKEKVELDYNEFEESYKGKEEQRSKNKDNEEANEEDDESDVEKTIIQRKAAVDLEKTVVRKVDLEKEFGATRLKKKEEESKLDEIEEILEQNRKEQEIAGHIVKLKDERQQNPAPAIVSSSDKTEMFSLTQVIPSINAELSSSEVELELQQKLDQKKEEKRLKKLQEVILVEQAIEEGADEEDIVVKENKKSGDLFVVIKEKKKKGMSLVAALTFIGILYYYFFDEEKPVIDNSPKYLEVYFPVIKEAEDSISANNHLVEARKLYQTGNYTSRALATAYYLSSLSNKYQGNEAVGEIVLTYAELLENAKDKNAAANTVFKYLQASENKLLTDNSLASGAGLFFGKINKPYTGIKVVENYLRVTKKSSSKLEAYYMNLLFDAGLLEKAKSVNEKLATAATKSFEIYNELANYEIKNENYPKARSYLEEGLKYYPNSVLLILNYCDILFREKSFDSLEKNLKKIEALHAERSPKFASDFYKLMGYSAAFKGKNDMATALFKKSLELYENDDLRTTLAALEISGSEAAQKLISESKMVDVLKKAEEQYRLGNLNTAFDYTIAAVDANPDNIPVALFHAKLNVERGIYQSAINTLLRISTLYPKNNKIKKQLIETYISAYKFTEAETALTELGQTNYINESGFDELMGKLMEAKNSTNLALRWYEKSIKKNPLNDEVIYDISRILVKSKKFNEARPMVAKAILLDPVNSKYHALYSEILFEVDGEDTAIGYIRDLLSEATHEDPILLATIATYYYKTGQFKEFERYYDKLKAMPKKNTLIYEVLLKSALLENRVNDFIKYSKELLEANPGNLSAKMKLGEVYYQEGMYEFAIEQFESVKELLPSYPKVNYYLAHVYIKLHNIVKAEEMAKKELELNPLLATSFYIMGEVHVLKEEYRDAVIMFEKSISLDSQWSEPLIAMAQIRIKQNYGSEAIDLLNRALRQDLSNPLVHKLLGDAYRAAGQRTLAREKYEDYLKLSPTASDKEQISAMIRNLQ